MSVPRDLSWMVPGSKVWYESSPGYIWPAVVSSLPFQGGVWMVRLEGLPEGYAETTCRGANYVPAAACSRVTPRWD